MMSEVEAKKWRDIEHERLKDLTTSYAVERCKLVIYVLDEVIGD